MFDFLLVLMTVDKRGEEIETSDHAEEDEKGWFRRNASGKGIELDKEPEQEKDVSEAVFVLEQAHIEEKFSVGHLKVKLIVEKTGEQNV